MNEDFPFWKITHVFYIRAREAFTKGEVSQAGAALKDMLEHDAFSAGDSRLRMIHCLGVLCVQEDKWVRAATWLGARDGMCAQSYWASRYFSPIERNESDQARAASLAALGEVAFAAARDAGRSMSEEQIQKFAQESLLL